MFYFHIYFPVLLFSPALNRRRYQSHVELAFSLSLTLTLTRSSHTSDCPFFLGLFNFTYSKYFLCFPRLISSPSRPGQLPSALFHIVFISLAVVVIFLCHILHANRIFLNFNWIFDWLYLCLYTHNSLDIQMQPTPRYSSVGKQRICSLFLPVGEGVENSTYSSINPYLNLFFIFFCWLATCCKLSTYNKITKVKQISAQNMHISSAH